MTTNIERATEVIGEWIDNNLPHSEDNFGADEGIAQALADADLLIPDRLWVEAQYRRNYDTGRYERHTRTVGEWVKNDD